MPLNMQPAVNGLFLLTMLLLVDGKFPEEYLREQGCITSSFMGFEYSLVYL